MNVRDRVQRLESITNSEAIELQKQMSSEVKLAGLTDTPRLIGGADVSYRRGDSELYAAVVVWDRAENKIVDRAGIARRPAMPYIPGLLSFRESPAVMLAYGKLKKKPEVLICDGQGYAHPRRFGLACHLGIELDLPSVGCGKTRLIGEHEKPGLERGSRTELWDKDDLIGYVLRTRRKVAPLYISPGHKIDFETSINVILASTIRYRQSEPIRAAHKYVNELRKAATDGS